MFYDTAIELARERRLKYWITENHLGNEGENVEQSIKLLGKYFLFDARI